MAVADIRLQYRRSLLGPFWVAITLLIQVSVIGLLFGQFFALDLAEYLIHLSVGMATWSFLVNVLNSSATALIDNGSLIRQVALPVSTFTVRIVARNSLQFAHNLVAVVPFVALSGLRPSLGYLVALLGFVLTVFNLGWLGVILSVVCARFRDLPAVINGFLVTAFYVTPVLWSIEHVSSPLIRTVLPFNPFFHVLVLVRAPFTGTAGALESVLVLCVVGLLGWAIATLALRAKGPLVPFWV